MIARGGVALAAPGIGTAYGAQQLFGGLGKVNRGLRQVHESVSDENGPAARNLLGLLPAGQEFDDPGEPSLLEFLAEKRTEASGFSEDPQGTLDKWLREYLALPAGNDDDGGPE